MLEINPQQQHTCTQLTNHILALIETHGAINFCAFMQLALYHPQWGYYYSDIEKIGPAGDFTTAPEISPIFAHCLAQYLKQHYPDLKDYHLLEIGAGKGGLAKNLLEIIHPAAYEILELNNDFRQQPHADPACIWLEDFPAKANRIIIANEVLDAFAVERWIKKSNVWHCAYVTNDHGGLSLQWQARPLHQSLCDHLMDWPEDKEYFYSPLLPAWLTALTDCSEAIIFMDYGSHVSELARMSTGGLRCYYQHHQHNQPLLYPGVFDITADVDFSWIKAQTSWQTEAYYTQAHFLLNHGVGTIDLMNLSPQQQLKTSQAIKHLVMPDAMGEIFKFLHLKQPSES